MAESLRVVYPVESLGAEFADHVRAANDLATHSTAGRPVSRRRRLEVQSAKVELLRRWCEYAPSEVAKATLAQAEANLRQIERTGRAYTWWPLLEVPGVPEVRGRSL